MADTANPTVEHVRPSTARRWASLAPVALALTVALMLAILIPAQWNGWMGDARWQSTDDAYLRGDLTPLSARVGGYVRRVLVSDYDTVRAGQPLVEIADDDYLAQAAQAQANYAGAEAAIANNLAQQALQRATIDAALAARAGIGADLARYRLEANRQHMMVASAAASQSAVEQADANLRRTAAQEAQGNAQVEAARRQLDVLRTQARQLAAARDGQAALVRLAQINLGYTRIVAPATGMVGERQVRPGQLVAAGTQVITLVPAPDLWVIANFKETQLARVRPGQSATITVDSAPGTTWRGHVATLSPASGSQFALLPPDNASGNFTKVVQRVPVKILLDHDNPSLDRLRPGLSVTARIDTSAR